jgi:hypothetical protein
VLRLSLRALSSSQLSHRRQAPIRIPTQHKLMPRHQPTEE